MKFSNKLYYVAAILLLVALMSQEVDARRKILRGRKTITRTYYKSAAIPAWAIIVLVAVGELIVGGVTYIVMKKTILDSAMSGNYAPPGLQNAPA